jgi:heat shock protein HtpX
VSALCIFGSGGGLSKLVSTHPPVEKRIEKLRN